MASATTTEPAMMIAVVAEDDFLFLLCTFLSTG